VELILPAKHALNGIEAFLEYVSIEQRLPATFGEFPASGIGIDIGHHATVEDRLPILPAIVNPIQADDCSMQVDANGTGYSCHDRQGVTQEWRFIVVAGSKRAVETAQRLLECLTGSHVSGARLVALTAAAIRGVALGVVGVAVIQALLIGVAFFAIGLPAAGILTLAALLLGIVQVPAALLTLPVIGYVLATEATTPAILFLVWTLVAGLSDNILKPLMLGRGLDAPMPVILIGVIGGMLADGVLGLFVGPVLLAVGYVLLIEWLRQHPAEGRPHIDGPPAL